MSEVSDRITQIKERLGRATPGPWSWASTGDKDNSWGLGVAYLTSDEDCTTPLTGCVNDALEAAHDEATGRDDDYFVDVSICTNDGSGGTFADAALIANAPKDLKWALDLIEEHLGREDGDVRSLAASPIEPTERERAQGWLLYRRRLYRLR